MNKYSYVHVFNNDWVTHMEERNNVESCNCNVIHEDLVSKTVIKL